MEMRFEQLTRGSGKIYMRLSWDGAPADAPICVNALSSTGEELPSTVYPLRGVRACVIILAVLSVTQYVTVSWKDRAGNTVGTISKSVKPRLARLTSQFNTFRKNKGAEAIRNIDEHQGQNQIFISYEWLIFSDEKEHDIVHGNVQIVSATKEDVLKELVLHFYDGDGRKLDGDTWTLMGDSCSPNIERSGLFERVVSFSVRVPKCVDAMACWAIQPSCNRSTIRCLRPFEMEDGRRGWSEFIEAAQYTSKYDRWFRDYHRVSPFELELQRNRTFSYEPVFSIVVPVYKTPIPFFREMVESVLKQSYEHFELILVNASPEDGALLQLMESYAVADNRIRIVKMDSNLGIVGNTYAGVRVAKGDFVSFFDHDDVIESDLLYCYAKGINEHPATDLLYCDEDKLCEGRYISPFFKPDWSPDLLCSENYVCHMLTVRKSIVDELPQEGLEVYEGSQDHYLTLYAGERARNVFHVRRVLYHWRMHEQSTATNIDSKSYTSKAGMRAVQAHLDRCGISASVRLSGVAPNTYHVDYELRRHPLVSIIIPNKDMVSVLRRCVDSIVCRSTYDAYEIVIVENNSVERQTFAYYEELRKSGLPIRVVELPSDGKFNFSRIINFGALQSNGTYLLFLNNDTEVRTPNWIELMLGPLTRPEVGVVGAKLLYPDGLVQHAGVMLHKGTGPFHVSSNLPADSLHHYCSIQLTCNYTAVTGACMMVSKQVFDEVGKFDEVLPVDYNDIDFCLRIREAGKLVVYEPEAVLTHYESISRGGHRSAAQRMQWCISSGLMLQRWRRYYAEGDPYSNPNLMFSAYHKLVDPTGPQPDAWC